MVFSSRGKRPAVSRIGHLQLSAGCGTYLPHRMPDLFVYDLESVPGVSALWHFSSADTNAGNEGAGRLFGVRRMEDASAVDAADYGLLHLATLHPQFFLSPDRPLPSGR